MDYINSIEQQLGLKLPEDYKEFLLKADTFIVENDVYCRVLQDNYRTDGLIYKFHTVGTFMENQTYREYLVDFQIHFENPASYVEAEYLYHIAEGTGSVCIALGGQHYGKIFSVDNGDFGIIYQAANILEFVDSLYEPSKFGCTSEELINAARSNNLELLTELVEERDGKKRIEYSSFLDIELFDTAYKNGHMNILRYLTSKGFKGFIL